ncbi:TetR/AcrR family transcriptional regulator [Nocardia takedensis]|uniref:TetR/AcrR family transcriptional regulator n=1 Tax=Nocardia takedensis TaxID=259390 RepID=UPI003F765688
MVEHDPPAAARGPRPRADAQRNRDKLLESARDAFAAGEGNLSMDALARRAGVGIGTLYRHFPTRQALVEAVYRAELDAVIDSAQALLDAYPADVGLRRWIDRYAGFVATKQGMAEAFQQAIASGAVAMRETRERVRQALALLLSAGVETGVLRDDIDPDVATMALLGAVVASRSLTETAQRARVFDLFVDGLRPR